MIKLLFLGSGSAFTVGANNFQANILLINEKQEKLLLDCGGDIRFSLHNVGYSYRDITDIYISHLHSDHVGGLEYIGFNSKFDPLCDRPIIYIHEDLKDDLWQQTLAGGMGFLEDEKASIESFFRLLASRDLFHWDDIKFELIKVIHVQSDRQLMPSYGLFFTINNQKIFLTTDTQLKLPELEKYYQEANIIFQDCEISLPPTKVHAHYQQLKALPQEIKSKMWLYGYQPGELPPAKQDGFLGFVTCGQEFEF